MNDSESLGSQALSLSKMMHLGVAREPLWEAEELGAILQHQLAAPLALDLNGIDPSLPDRLPQWAAAAGPPLRTFRDLFQHPHPPVELLELTKRFAKLCRSHPESTLPEEVATLLYFLALAVALAKCGCRISKLSDAALRDGIAWALGQPWLDEITRQTLREVAPVPPHGR
jgi:hypothetical protein